MSNRQYICIIALTAYAILFHMEKIRGLNWAIANVVKKLRESRRLTQAQLAGFAGLSEVYLSSLERGIRGDSINALMLIARVLEVNFGELMGQVEAELARGAEKPKTVQGRSRPSSKPKRRTCPTNHPA